MYKTYYHLLPYNLQCLFLKVENIHTFATSHENNFYKKSVRTSFKSMTLSINSVNIWNNIWNNLNDEIKLCNNLNLFKKKLKLYFYISQYNVNNVD